MRTDLKWVNTKGKRLRLVDAKDQVVGRLAAHLSNVLQGKDKPTFAPHKDEGDVVIVKNAQHVSFTGKKWDRKLYRWHTGFPGGLKERQAKDQHERDPVRVLYNAVYGMLPKNKLRKARALKLRLFPGSKHPFEEHPQLVPWEPPPRRIRIREPLPDLEEGYEPMNPDAYLRRFGHMLPESAKQAIRSGHAASGSPPVETSSSELP
ncbi:hypothetical protein WJX74_007538 [Apatococcus lobatus]|uniref:50S ribosomal protein L13 n=2 Tax=Apatococcus TaxID=904362 RepID=A0AAW1T226_9CHLO